MKLFTAVASCAAVVALLVVPAAGVGAGPPRGALTYDQAVARGLPTLPAPAQVGLRRCHPDRAWKGFPTSEAAERAAAAADEAPSCVADPREVLYSHDAPPPGPSAAAATGSYRHNGAQTRDRFEGGRITVEVGNPDVVHNGSFNQFAAARSLSKTPIGNWVESGWAEVSWQGDTRYAYSYDSPERVWHFHTAYPLANGRYYVFRTRDANNTSGWAEIYWAGSWHLLETNDAMLCRYSYGTRNCGQEEYAESYTADGYWPEMNAPVDGTGVNFTSTMLRTGPSTWVLWNDSLYPSSEDATAPYSVCWANRDWVFRVAKGNC